MAALFTKGFEKSAGIKDFVRNPHHMDQLGLGVLGASAGIHGYKAIKEKSKGDAAAAGLDLAGLGILSRAAKIAHK